MLHKVFCCFESLKQIILYPEKYPKLRELVIRHDQLYLDLSQEALNNEIRNPMLQTIKLLGRPTFKPVADLQDQLELYLRKEAAGSLFILPYSPIDCQTLSERFGVCIISTQVPYQLSGVLAENFFRQLDAHQSVYNRFSPGGRQGWRTILNGAPQLIMNAMVLIDNYLFTNTALSNGIGKLEKGKSNLIDFLDTILPKRLDCDFHLLLVTSNKNQPLKKSRPQGQQTPKILDEILNEIITELNREYNIEIGIITHDSDKSFHRRAIITNYHFGTSDRGFSCFNDSTLIGHNDIRINCSFENIPSTYSDSPYLSMLLELRSVKRLRDENKQLIVRGTDINKLSYLHCGNCENRLLSLI